MSRIAAAASYSESRRSSGGELLDIGVDERTL
jgi:hypothetical protein